MKKSFCYRSAIWFAHHISSKALYDTKVCMSCPKRLLNSLISYFSFYCGKPKQFFSVFFFFFKANKKVYEYALQMHRLIGAFPSCLRFENSCPFLHGVNQITKTRLYNADPLKPHFYIVKLGLTGVYIIFLISAQNIDCGSSLEPPRLWVLVRIASARRF